MKFAALWCSGLLLATGIAVAGESRWQTLPDLPQAVAGQFVGVSDGALLVAGGSSYPVSLFQGGIKRWVDTISVLEPGKREWRTGFTLEQPLAYGAAVSTANGLICLGGGDAQQNSAAVFRLNWRDGKVGRTPLPALPSPCAMTVAALVGDTIYVAGGQETPAATTALHNFWALDLKHQPLHWQVLPSWPGPGRILPAAAGDGHAFYLFGGCELSAGADGKAVRRYLTDAYRYRPGKGWEKLADLPHPVAAAPALASGGKLLVFGGDDGAYAQRIWELKEAHPGFRRDILTFDPATGIWRQEGSLPVGLVTTSAVRWGKRIVIPGGEDRPGHRAARVLSAALSH